ncbi:MAG: hypothetical protein SFT81_01820 [Candidatus Caenarcaniphilales bacterium]|nr:hypothetical protein [Candidatus Caenarcaniphilales bacterium]
MDAAYQVCNKSSLGIGLGIILQDTMLVTLPKILFGLLVRHSGYIGLYEALVDAFDAIGLYILPVPLAKALSPSFAKGHDIPDPALLGAPMHELKDQLGKEIELSHGKGKVVVDHALLNRIGRAKTFQFAAIAGFGIAAEFIATALRALIFPMITKVDNFYAIAGLQVPEDQKKGGDEAKAAQARAWDNLKKALAFIAISIPGLLGLSYAVNHFRKPTNTHLDLWSKFSTHFDLAKGFGVSKMSTLPNLLLSVPAYMSVAYNKAGALEDCVRLLFVTIPSVLFFNQIGANLLAGGLARLKYGAKNLLLPWKQIHHEMKTGKREWFDLGAIDPKYLAQHPEFKKLPFEKQQALRQDFHFSQNYGVFMLAFVLGIATNFLNMFRTKDLQQNDLQNNSQKSDDELNRVQPQEMVNQATKIYN